MLVVLGPVVIAQLVLQLLRALQQIILLSLLIRMWEAAFYGDWVIIVTISTFFMMFDFGIQTVLSNRGIALSRDADAQRFQELVSQSLGFYAIYIPIILLVSVAFASAVGIETLSRPVVLKGVEANLAFLALSFSFLLNILLNSLGAIYAARGDVAKGIERVCVQLVLQTAVVVSIVYLTDNVVAVAIAYPLSAALSIAYVVFDIGRRYPALSLRPRFDGVMSCLGALRLGAFYFINPFASYMALNIPMFYAAANSDSHLIAAYAVIRTLVGLLRQLSVQISNAVGALIVRNAVRDDGASDHRTLYAHAGRFIGASAGVLSGYLAASAVPFASIWTGGQVHIGSWLAFIATGVFCISAPTYLPMALLQLRNRPQLLTAGIVIQVLFGTLSALILPANSFNELLMMLGAIECGTNVAIILAARRKGFLPETIDGMPFLYSVVGFAAAFAVSDLSLNLVSQNGVTAFLASSALSFVPLAALIWLLGFSEPMRRELLVMLRGKLNW